jgi:hypothetical protein
MRAAGLQPQARSSYRLIRPQRWVRDLAVRLTADFARNPERRLSGAGPDPLAEAAQQRDGVALLIDLLRTRPRETLRQVSGR